MSGARQVQVLTAPTIGVTLQGLLIFLSLSFIICKMGVAHSTYFSEAGRGGGGPLLETPELTFEGHFGFED